LSRKLFEIRFFPILIKGNDAENIDSCILYKYEFTVKSYKVESS